MAQVKILFYEPNTGQEIVGTVKEWDNAPQGKICRGILIETDSEAVLIAPTEQKPRTIATVQYCTDRAKAAHYCNRTVLHRQSKSRALLQPYSIAPTGRQTKII